MFKVPVPVFWIVNVLVKVDPQATFEKSVWSVKLGVRSLSAIETAFPVTLISGVGAVTLICTWVDVTVFEHGAP